ncbi:hypothetical protein TRFO_43010 [Tritrichomonas foetus]|uniref:Uncharacterized protein n=1 Tax=Tritrichomonas foetus TaxID=1144522 RepID=A0A1J4KY80_9EUKA|nr:hypothetical protein TRFO_43010 [Tritrichomonas foetus]|eukprot:OHT14509.1 hypothetical protein TRFO_43010 [Tritrichomonas foetus]
MIISIIAYFVVSIVEYSSNQEVMLKMGKIENFVAIGRDSIIAIMFLCMFLYLRKRLEIKYSLCSMCNFSQNSQEQAVLFSSLAISFALVVRVSERLIFVLYVLPNKISQCSVFHLLTIIYKEILGQLLPLSYVFITDYTYSSSKYESLDQDIIDANSLT